MEAESVINSILIFKFLIIKHSQKKSSHWFRFKQNKNTKFASVKSRLHGTFNKEGMLLSAM